MKQYPSSGGMKLHDGPLLGERDGRRVIDCQACGWAHLEQLPDERQLDQFYQDEFWQHEKAGALERFQQQHEWWMETYGGWLELAAAYGARDLLDVGCGYGLLMEAAQARGWPAMGIEPNRMAAQYAQQYGVVKVGSWKKFSTSQFSCVAALWLMEHLPQPCEFLDWCRFRLREQGVLLAVVPHDFTALQRLANEHVKRPYWWIDHTHLNYFNWSSFSNLLGRAGFRIVERQTLFPMEKFLCSGEDDYTADEALGAQLHTHVERHDLTMERTQRLSDYRRRALEGEGREIVVVAVKE